MASGFGMKTYMKGAAILTIASLLVKVLSAIYRVPFQNMVGDEGFYIYQQVYPFISIFVTWAAAGFAVAVSKLLADLSASNLPDVAERKRDMMQIVFGYLTILSFIFFGALFGGADLLASYMGDTQLAPILRTGSLIVLVMPALAMVKGDFQSRAMLSPIAYASVFEQFIRVCMILTGTFIIMRTSGSVYAAGHMAIAGTMVAEYIAFFALFIFYRKSFQPALRYTKPRLKRWPVIKEVTLLSLSVSMSSLLLLCYQLVDSFTIFNTLLENGLVEQVAKETKGVYDRGQPLVQLGVVIASSLALAVVPLVAHMSKKTSKRGAIPFIQLTFRTSVLFGGAAALGLVLVMHYINQMLFQTDKLSEVLSLYVVQIVPLSIVLTFTAILQGYGKLKWPAVILAIGMLIKLIGNVTLVGPLGVLGAAIASNAGLFFSAIGLLIYIKKIISIQLATTTYYKKFAIAAGSMIVVVLLWTRIMEWLLGGVNGRTDAAIIGMSAVLLGAFVMISLVAKMRMLSEKEWFLLPFGRKMALYQLWLNRKK